MGFLSGVVGELNRREDKAARREEFMMNLLEKRKAAILPQIIDRIEKRNAKVAARLTRLDTAVNDYKFTKEAASILETSGRLDSILSGLGKPADVNVGNVQVLSEVLVGNLKPDQVADAVEYAFNSGYAETPSMDLLVNAISANSQEDFMEALGGLNLTAPTTAPSLGEINVNERALRYVDEEDLKKRRSNIVESVGGILDTTVFVETGQRLSKDDPNRTRIIQNAVEYYEDKMNDPEIQYSPSEVTQDLFDRIDTLTQTEGVTLADIAQNYSTFDLTELPEVPKTEVPKPANNNNDATEDMFNTPPPGTVQDPADNLLKKMKKNGVGPNE